VGRARRPCVSGWVTFGDTTGDGFETGTIAADGVTPLPFEPDAATLNIFENQFSRFIHSLYYGLMTATAIGPRPATWRPM
jgi:hypothetical protein